MEQPACSARVISRWTDETDAPVRDASPVGDHSCSGPRRTSVRISACNLDRSSGSNGCGEAFCISRNVVCVICKRRADASAGVRHARTPWASSAPLSALPLGHELVGARGVPSAGVAYRSGLGRGLGYDGCRLDA